MICSRPLLEAYASLRQAYANTITIITVNITIIIIIIMLAILKQMLTHIQRTQHLIGKIVLFFELWNVHVKNTMQIEWHLLTRAYAAMKKILQTRPGGP